jgi:glutamine synthetase
MKIKAEYIWIDGQTPTGYLRSKTKIMEIGTEPPLWGFDGSSTEQATGEQSDCVLKPVTTFKDPCRYDSTCLKYTCSLCRGFREFLRV